MTSLLIGLYLAFGLGFYIGMSVKDPTGFIKADAASLLRGLILAFIAWPVGLIFSVYLAIEELNEYCSKIEK